MKIAFNETQTTVILNGGRLELHPKGSLNQRDRRQISDQVAELPDVKRFALLGKISILSVEEVAKRELTEKQTVADTKARAAVKAVKEADKAAAEVAAVTPAPVPEPTVEATPASAEEPTATPEPTPSANEEASERAGKSMKRRGRH